jgi:hypothetical protein
MNYKEALELVKLPKWVVNEYGDIVDEMIMEQEFPMRKRLLLTNTEGVKHEFVLDVKQSEKFGIRLNFQMMDDMNWGLARLDYNGNHKNPDKLSEDVPEIFHSHVAELFVGKAHLHYHVDGYPQLAWALPLNETDIATKDVTEDYMIQGFVDAFEGFVSYINVQTRIVINKMVI